MEYKPEDKFEDLSVDDEPEDYSEEEIRQLEEEGAEDEGATGGGEDDI